MPGAAIGEGWTVVPRSAIRLPLEMPQPEGFDPARPDTWPDVPGRLEYLEGRLLYLPPCGDAQQQTAVDLSRELSQWQEHHRVFVVGGNEAGMLLGREVRAADAAVWRRAELGPPTGGFPRVPPVLAAEVAGRDDPLEMLAAKASWYVEHGVEVVWILVPETRTVRVVTRDGSTEAGPHGRVPAHPSLPGLTPRVEDLFRQLGQAPDIVG
jgi:Uma2 family endonuclease